MVRFFAHGTRLLLGGVVCIGCAGLTSASSISGSVVHTIETPPYEIISSPDGQEIRVDGFGIIGESGKPMLPGRIFAFAVPPGSVIKSVSCEGVDPVEVGLLRPQSGVQFSDGESSEILPEDAESVGVRSGTGGVLPDAFTGLSRLQGKRPG